MMTITEAVTLLEQLEGGKGTEADGQHVNLGVDQKSYDAWCQERTLPSQDVWTLPQEDIDDFYADSYWIPLRCYQLAPALAFVLFQYALNVEGAGDRGQAVKDLQLLTGATPDGFLGNETVAAVNKFPDSGKLASMLLDRQEAYYQRLTAENPSDPIRGWTARVEKTRTIIQNL